MPNSAARFRLLGTGGASPSLTSVLDLIKLAPRGGRGRERSGPETDGLRCLGGDSPCDLSDMLGRLPEDSFEGLRILVSGSEGLLFGGS